MANVRKGVVLLLAVLMLMPAASALAAGVPAITASRGYAFLKDVEEKIIVKTNAVRKENGKAELTPNALLTRSAEYKSLYPLQYLKADGTVYNEHAFATGPAKVIDENSTDAAAIETAGITSRDMFGLVNGENMAYTTGFADADAERLAQALVDSWMNSPAHKDALLSADWQSIGVGVAITDKGIMCIQHFSKANPTSGDAVPNPMVTNQSEANGWFQRTNNAWSYALDGVLQTGWQSIRGGWYYLDALGIMQTGWYSEQGKWYYLDEDGKMQSGWIKVGKDWFYLNGDGTRKHGSAVIGGKRYYFDEVSGVMKTGWATNSAGKWMYLNSSGIATTGWVKDKGRWYLFGADGIMKTGWQKDGGKWYYLSDSGAMAINWARLDGKWYFLGGNGAMRSGWEKISNKWYFFRGSGVMVTGWQKLGGKWYYMEANGAMKTGWLKDGGKWYYLKPSTGQMATGRVTIGGKVNNFSSSGVWQG